MSSKLTDHKFIIFDVYGTLADWETGIYTALQPLLSHFPAAYAWSQKEAILAFASVESDIQAQNPTMLYSDLLAKVHEALEARLMAAHDLLSGGTSATTLSGNPEISISASSASRSASDPNIDNIHTAFGNSVKYWSIFPDSSKALHDLAKHFKLIVLSNVDHSSFAHTHSYLSENTDASGSSPSLSTYSRPFPNLHPRDLWLPRTTPNSESPFSLILTAQDTHAYKPSLDGFNTAFEIIRTESTLSGGLGLLTTEDVKSKVLIVAQSVTHDHIPARQLGLQSVWIDRKGAAMRPDASDTEIKWTWRFETLGELAKAVDEEIAREA